jgi:hypothetical protein
MTRITPESPEDIARLDRLPSWARTEINVLRRNIRDLEARMAAGPADSDTFVEGYSRPSTPLGTGPTIRFDVGPKDLEHPVRDDYVEVQNSDGKLYVRGSRSLAVLPSSGNAVWVRLA